MFSQQEPKAAWSHGEMFNTIKLIFQPCSLNRHSITIFLNTFTDKFDFSPNVLLNSVTKCLLKKIISEYSTSFVGDQDVSTQPMRYW